MKYLIILFIFVIHFFTANTSYSQGLHTSSGRASKLYHEGQSAFNFFDFRNAEEAFKKAVSIDSMFYEAYLMLGELTAKERRFIESSAYYKKAISIDSLFFKPIFFNAANSEMMSGDYINALIHYKVYLNQAGMLEKNRKIAEKNIKDCEFAITAIKNPVLFNPVSVGSSINTKDDEYWPSITADNQTLMFTRQYSSANSPGASGQINEDFWLSYFSGNTWQEAFNAGPPLNTRQNEGAQSLSSDGNYMFFTACDRPGGMGSCDIYFSAHVDGRWSEPANLRYPVNTSSWESQPSISADGKVLFFSSSRSGGFGGKDIWFSVLNSKNGWKTPVNMGKGINSSGDEMSPFIHFDGQTLYFASNGRVGMGGFDIYMTRMNEDSTWTDPQNLGYPINTFNDEMGLITESIGQKAYFSSVRDKSNGKDIFYFNLYESVRPNPVSYIKGKVYDKKTGKILKADYELINLSTGNVSVKSSTDGAGNFLVCLPSGFNYGINVSKPGYLFYSESFMLEGEHSAMEPFIKKISLNPFSVGASMELSNVFYEIDSWELKEESKSELNNLVNLLNANKDLIMEIGGYTDSTGSAEYNLVLSEKRALSVVSYLIQMGISSERLNYKGYGNSSPVGDNTTIEGRKLNRRTEAKIIANSK